MSDTFTKRGFTYTRYGRIIKGKIKWECIKYEKGLRNMWERISFNDYKTAKNKHP